MENKFLPRYIPYIMGRIQLTNKEDLIDIRKAVEGAGIDHEYCAIALEIEICTQLEPSLKDAVLAKRIEYWNVATGIVHTTMRKRYCNTDNWHTQLNSDDQSILEKVYSLLSGKAFDEFKARISPVWAYMRSNEYLNGYNEKGVYAPPIIISSSPRSFFEPIGPVNWQ